MNFSAITSTYRGKLIIEAYSTWINNKDRILDVGCGTGVITKQIAEQFNAKVTGCDIENYLTEKISIIMIDKDYKLPFPNQSFDIIMLNDVLHHIKSDEQEKLINESLRVAKKVLIFEAEPTVSGMIFDFLLNILHYGGLDAPLSFKNIEGWGKLFKKSKINFKAIRIRKPFWYPFSHIAFSLWKT